MISLMVCLSILGDDNPVKKKLQNTMIALTAFKKYVVPIVQAEQWLEYKSGQVIFYQGHRPCGVYILKKGRVRLFSKDEYGEKLIRIVLPGHVLGVDEMGESRPFDFGARAETDVFIVFFSRSNLKTQ
jgi:CRP-like cAMP-binding protein